MKSLENLAMNDKCVLAVQSMIAYWSLPANEREADDLEAIREGLAESLAGNGRSAEEFFAEFEAKHGLC